MKKSGIFHNTILRNLFLLVIFTGVNVFALSAAHARETFPIFPAMQANVSFWEMIYEKLSAESAVIHDRTDLSKIYAIIPLMNSEAPGATEENQRILRNAEATCSTILKTLAQGHLPASPDEKRIAAFFSGPNARDRMLSAADNVRSQRGLKERFLQGVQRSGAYMAEIKRIFVSCGLPQELAYLPHVESSFNVNAYSKYGAAGAWQFTRSTGAKYLRISDAIDERLDPLLSAQAAASYLKNSYEILGDWPLALTAYNYGTPGMVRAKNAKGSYERIFSEYAEGYFKFASRNFYSEFIAATLVARRLEQNPAISLDRPKASRMYVLPSSVCISDIERYLKVHRGTVQQLNPALRPVVISGKASLPKGYALRLPAAAPAQVGSLPPQPGKINPQKNHPTHIVQKGETIYSIAQRYSIGVQVLMQANGLGRNDRLLVGQKLAIPQICSRDTVDEPLRKNG